MLSPEGIPTLYASLLLLGSDDKVGDGYNLANCALGISLLKESVECGMLRSCCVEVLATRYDIYIIALIAENLHRASLTLNNVLGYEVDVRHILIELNFVVEEECTDAKKEYG